MNASSRRIWLHRIVGSRDDAAHALRIEFQEDLLLQVGVDKLGHLRPAWGRFHFREDRRCDVGVDELVERKRRSARIHAIERLRRPSGGRDSMMDARAAGSASTSIDTTLSSRISVTAVPSSDGDIIAAPPPFAGSCAEAQPPPPRLACRTGHRQHPRGPACE